MVCAGALALEGSHSALWCLNLPGKRNPTVNPPIFLTLPYRRGYHSRMNRRPQSFDVSRPLLLGLMIMVISSNPVAAFTFSEQPFPAQSSALTKSPEQTSPSITTREAVRSSPTVNVTITITHPSQHVLNVSKRFQFPSNTRRASVVTIASRWPNDSKTGITAKTTGVTNGHLSRSKKKVTWSGNGPLVINSSIHVPALPLGTNAPAILTQHGVVIKQDLTARAWTVWSSSPPRVRRTYRAPQNPSVNGSHGSLYIGPHREYTTSTQNETIQLIVAAGANETLTPSPRTVLGAYRNASRLLAIGHRPQRITVFAIPERNHTHPETIGEGGTGQIIIFANTSLNRTSTTEKRDAYVPWLHEYVHTRQAMTQNEYGPKMQWYIEATANYYAALIAYNEHKVSYPSLWHTLNDTAPSSAAPLSNSSTWLSPDYQYYRGPQVIAFFDAQIRQETNGLASFLDVVRAVNSQTANGSTITLNEFKQILNRYLPKDTVNRTVSRYITGIQPVPLPTRRANHVLPPVRINTSGPSPAPPALHPAQTDPGNSQPVDSTTSPSQSSSPSTAKDSIWRQIQAAAIRYGTPLVTWITTPIRALIPYLPTQYQPFVRQHQLLTLFAIIFLAGELLLLARR